MESSAQVKTFSLQATECFKIKTPRNLSKQAVLNCNSYAIERSCLPLLLHKLIGKINQLPNVFFSLPLHQQSQRSQERLPNMFSNCEKPDSKGGDQYDLTPKISAELRRGLMGR